VNEANITINGVPCTSAMAATIRVAVENMASDLRENGLGDDEHGRVMTKLTSQESTRFEH
jgi:hypothetical protein